MYYIYKLYFDDPKRCYIGYTKDLEYRMTQHLSPSLLATKTKKTTWIKSKLAKGLTLNYKIIDTALCIAMIKLQEKYWITYYTNNPEYKLYNGTLGGDGITGYKFTRAQIEARGIKISEATRGKVKTTEMKERISKTNKVKGIQPPFSAREASRESNRKDYSITKGSDTINFRGTLIELANHLNCNSSYLCTKFRFSNSISIKDYKIKYV